MTLDEIQKEWGVDSVIDPTDLVESQVSQNSLKAKYMNFRSAERIKLRALEMEGTKLRFQRSQYYLAELPLPVLRELGWAPWPKKVIKTELNQFLESDEILIDHNLKVNTAREKVDYLEDVIKSLTYLNSMIKNIIDVKKFENGIS